MPYCWARFLIFAVFVQAGSALADGDRDYRVAGVVVNARGGRAQSASVVAVPIVPGGMAGSLHWISTDAEGRFKLRLASGSYEIRAKDEGHGYPDPNFLLLADVRAHFPVVKVKDADVDGLRIVLGEQGGTLRILIRDRDTGHPITGAKATVRDAQDESAFVELNTDENGVVQIAVPRKALVVFAEASGYSREMFRHGEKLGLANGDQKDVSIDLTRLVRTPQTK